MTSQAIQIAFTDMIQLYHNLVTEIREIISSIIDAIQTSIHSKSYVTGLPSLQRWMCFEVFNLTLKINSAEPAVRLQTLFFKSIISDCEEAKIAIDNNISDSAETYNQILHQVLAVSARSDFDEEIGGVVAAQESLIAHIGLACDKTTSEFQTMFAEHDIGIYRKIIGKVATIDLLRSHKLVLSETSGKYHALTDAIKTSVESYSKEAIRQISDISTMQSTDMLAPTIRMEENNAVSLKRLLILINDASTFKGCLQSAYRNELDNVMNEIYKMNKVLSDHVAKGENGRTISFKNHSNLKSLHFKRSAVCSLRKVIVDCVDSVPVLVNLPNMMSIVLKKCDTAVAKAAMEGIMQQYLPVNITKFKSEMFIICHYFFSIVGMAHVKNLIAIKVSDMADVSANAIFKNNLRDALLFFDAAKSLGFPSFLTDDHEKLMVRAFEHIMKVAENIDGLQLSQDGEEEDGVGSSTDIEGSYQVVKDIFQFLTVFESLFFHDDGWYILKMKESIHGALELLRESVLDFLTYLKMTAEDYKSGGNLNPIILDELHQNSQLCELYSSIDNYFPADSSFKFTIVGQSFKSLIIDIITSTKSKIRIHDYSGTLHDLKMFDSGIPSVLKEVEHIILLAFKELHDDASKIARSAPTYQFCPTTSLANQDLINDLRNLSRRSVLFMAYVGETQKTVIGLRLEIVTMVNETTSLICDECKSSLNSLQLSSVKFDFVEAEGMIKSAESMLFLLEELADEMANDRKAQEPFITQVKPSEGASFFSSLLLPYPHFA